MERLTAIRNFIFLHRAKFAAAATSAVFISMMVSRGREWDKFLREHDLYSEFYSVITE